MFYTDCINRHRSCLFLRYVWYDIQRAFITKVRAIILFTNTTLNRLGFEITATGHFHFQNNETEDMLVYQSNAEGVDLFSHVNTFFAHWLYVARFVPRNLGETEKSNYTFSPLIPFSGKQPSFMSKRRDYTTRSQTTAFCSLEKSYSFH